MTAHNKDYDLATTPNMTFDEVFPEISPVVGKSTADCASRFDSVPYDEQRADIMMPDLTPASPCVSEVSHASISITGRYSNIEHRYHVDPRVLGSGHHGSVRECTDRVTGRKYAVKSIRKTDPAVKPGGLAREIALLKEMKHDSIVRLVDVYEDTDYVHLVTDLCTGGELFDEIVRQSSSFDNGAPCFTEPEAARILHQILEAVSYMHDRDVAHRDIKPENILFETKDKGSRIKIIDFGLARKHFGSHGEPPMSTIVGTPYYIAPDVLRKRYDKSCDLWSVGVIAYILLCGYPPFNGPDNEHVYDAVRRGRYRFPSSDWSGTSSEARDFIRCLLQRDAKRMTADQALNHPWILRHVGRASNVVEMSEEEEDEERQDNSSVEVVFHGLSRRESIICGGTPPRRKVRTALFADL